MTSSNEFHDKNHELGEILKSYRLYRMQELAKTKDELRKTTLELVKTISKEHPDWSFKKIAYFIAAENYDLIGLSYRTIYNLVKLEDRPSPKKIGLNKRK